MKTKAEFEKEFQEIFGKRTLHWASQCAQFKVDRLSFAKIEQLRALDVVKDVTIMPQAIHYIPQYPTFLVDIEFSLVLSDT